MTRVRPVHLDQFGVGRDRRIEQRDRSGNQSFREDEPEYTTPLERRVDEMMAAAKLNKERAMKRTTTVEVEWHIEFEGLTVAKLGESLIFDGTLKIEAKVWPDDTVEFLATLSKSSVCDGDDLELKESATMAILSAYRADIIATALQRHHNDEIEVKALELADAKRAAMRAEEAEEKLERLKERV